VMSAGPIGCEGLDDVLVADMKRMNIHPQDAQLLPEGKGWLLVEFGGETKEESDARARALMATLQSTAKAPSMTLIDDKEKVEKLWKVREAGLGATARLANGEETW